MVQFTEGFMTEAMALMPELAVFRETLERSRRGLLFSAATSAEVGPMLADLGHAQGIGRLALFLNVIGRFPGHPTFRK